MAETNIVGLTGAVVFPDVAGADLFNISITSGQELLDVSAFGNNGYRRRVAGIKDLAGSASAYLTKGAAGTNPFALTSAGGAMTITFDTGCTIGFTAVIGNVTIVGEYAGNWIVSFTWAKNDTAAPTVTWVTS